MSNLLQERGEFEIFRTTEEHYILRLGTNEIFAIVKTNKGPILVKTDEDHKKKETVQEGQYYLMDSEEDTSFQELPHLIFEKDGIHQEFLLPAVSGDAEIQKKIILTTENEGNIRHHIKYHEKAERKKDTNPNNKRLIRTDRKQHALSRTKNNQKELLKASGQIKE